MQNDIETRRKTYFTLNTQLSQYDNQQLSSLLEGDQTSRAWGRNEVIKLGKTKVFVKRIPVTDIEHQNYLSTKNLYRLPTYYNFGVGSAGMGIYREIVALIKTTNWVLSGAIENFPLMYHHRILPFEGQPPQIDPKNQAGYVRYWNSNKQIGQYWLDRAHAKYEAVVFLEYFPYTLGSWLEKNWHKLDMVLADMQKALTFLRQNRITHFDSHAGNIKT